MNMNKDEMKTFAQFMVILTITLSMFVVPFLFMWNDHTSKIQDIVDLQFGNYQEPDWTAMNIQAWTNSAFGSSKVWGGQWDIQERYDYNQSLYDVVFAYSNNLEEVDGKIEAANLAYDEWKDAVEYFTNNRLYAMYYTF
jgi:hypothetical protein